MNRKKVLISIIIFTAIIILLMIFLNFNHRYEKLEINKTMWEILKSSLKESSHLKLTNIKFNDYSLIIDEKNSVLYYSIINDNKTKYNPTVSFNSNEDKVKIAILSDEITREKINANHEFKIMIYNDSKYHIYKLICLDLPVLNITYNNKSEGKTRNIPMDMYFFDNLSNTSKKIEQSSGKLNILEDGYKFLLTTMSPGKNTRKNNISLFNMNPNDEYVLYKVDKNKNENGQENNTLNHYIELFINNEYKGLYLLEQFKPDSMNK